MKLIYRTPTLGLYSTGCFVEIVMLEIRKYNKHPTDGNEPRLLIKHAHRGVSETSVLVFHRVKFEVGVSQYLFITSIGHSIIINICGMTTKPLFRTSYFEATVNSKTRFLKFTCTVRLVLRTAFLGLYST